jgi:hypothetical protein
MKVAYRKRFLKDLASVPANLRGPIERFVFEELPLADSLQSTGKIAKLKGRGGPVGSDRRCRVVG